MGWTEQQQSAIDARDSSIIVSAAAGSGKTAVLTERLTRLLADPESGVAVDLVIHDTGGLLSRQNHMDTQGPSRSGNRIQLCHKVGLFFFELRKFISHNDQMGEGDFGPAALICLLIFIDIVDSKSGKQSFPSLQFAFKRDQ